MLKPEDFNYVWCGFNKHIIRFMARESNLVKTAEFIYQEVKLEGF